MSAERKEAVRAWAVLGRDDDLAQAAIFRREEDAKQYLSVWFAPDEGWHCLPVEIRPAPTGEGQNE